METHYDPYPRQAAPPGAPAYAPARLRPGGGRLEQAPTAHEPAGFRLDGLALAALLLVAFLVGQSLLERIGGAEDRTIADETEPAAEAQAAPAEVAQLGQEAGKVPLPLPAGPETAGPALDVRAIVYPYDDYWLTQGPHGFSYGHMAIDLAAGKGVPIKSPIHGQVTANYIDQYGNTTLIIENDVYLITLLHGDFSAVVGQEVALGDLIGAEGNNGYTTDMQGRSCRNRDCGYHSHLNVFSKESQSNVNPLDVLR